MQRPGTLACLALLATLDMGGANAAARCRIGRYPLIPVTVRNMQALINVKINGTPAVMAVDTGSASSLVSAQAVRRLKLSYLHTPGYLLSGVGGSTQPQLVSAHRFAFADQQLHDMPFLVAGAGSPLHSIGLLGDNFLRFADVEFDLAKGFMRFVKPVHCGSLPLAYWAGKRPFGELDLYRPTRDAPQFIGPAVLDGQPISVVFDTGSGRSVLSLSTAERLHIGPGNPGVKAAGRVSGIARRFVKAWIAPVARLSIGGETIEHTHLLVAPLGRIGLMADLVIGLDFFLAHHVYIANSQSKLYFTYSGGPVFAFGQRTRTSAAAAVPVGTAPELLRRGLAAQSRQEYSQALADFDRACALDPTDAQCLLYRGQTHLAARQPALALADFDTALRLKPQQYPALLGRAAARLALRRGAAARTWSTLTAAATTDLTAASRVLPRDSATQLKLGMLANQAGAFALAIRAYDAWIHYHRPEVGLPFARDGLCWSWAAENRHLHRALRECDRALARLPGSTPVLDSRGLVDLRLGNWRHALRDYDAALEAHPHRPLPLYGRGLAELHLGKTSAAHTDFAAAQRIDADTARRYAQIGLAP